ncbi:uncharacterized protein PITG_00404 [Phytophthora infestans T30-4]|uniref:Uncharacterized protein n=1 Tax=Phytophthora infestans (strain T30-4) TaxID=403677 RepID=D0MQQ2_PHYIT|nr:uncharacterized protein PITG_00404 [Phytophthora infestans T30-4]EEY57821.1 hypothetical protein PITG_00404 [Phytophthora infestans T30-4]|eukprot:XP_002909007.1 hypothetical protein PITG_00404 [Phytophthora infestans T30-4]
MLPAATAAAASGLGANNKPIFTFTRRKLQMEISTLAAKLDSILRSSPWMRRKVVLQPQMNSPSQRGFSNVSSPRLLPQMEKRIMATFRRFVRLWRERKRRSEQAALSILRRELDAQSSNVASILSRRMIGEVPALKFFDEIEPLAVEQKSSSPTSPVRTIGDMMASLSLKDGGLRSSPVRRATPRGVCYTLDASGCRRIKMQSEMTIERATSKSLRRKMIRRVKVKHRAISMLTDDFAQSKKALTAKLGSQLALRQAESESTFGKRLSLHLSNNVELPPHMTSKEFALARLRFKKANLQACCQTLALLAAVRSPQANNVFSNFYAALLKVITR